MRKVDDKVYLFTEEILSSRSIRTQKKDLQKKTWKKKVTEELTLAEHGFATDRQRNRYLTIGSLFWITVMLIGTTSRANFYRVFLSANLVSLEK